MPSAEAAIDRLRKEARGCTACDLYRLGTQTVFGEGPAPAAIMMVGEQPGDQEDIAGRPFVGPAGGILDRALVEAGVDRGQVYLTNAVKHFKHVPRGKRRLHQKPVAGEINACHRWFEAELDVVNPAVVVAMGGTAARSILGRTVKILSERGSVVALANDRSVFLTIHPSMLLRLRDADQRRAEFKRFVGDLARLPMMLPGARARGEKPRDAS